jgi:hypothetical protein
LSDCFLIFSIGTFRTNSYLRHPVDCAEIHLLLDSTVLSLHYCQCHLVAVAHPCRSCHGRLLRLRVTTTAWRRRRRRAHWQTRRRQWRRRRLNPIPASEAATDVTTLPPASAGVRAGQDRRIISGSAALCAELEQLTPLQSKPCALLHFKRDSAADWSFQFQ